MFILVKILHKPPLLRGGLCFETCFCFTSCKNEDIISERKERMRTRESEEMYLETILLLKRKKGSVRSVDVVEELGYAKSSVSRAVNLLVQKGYVVMDRNGDLTLTANGEKKASSVFERHFYITRALVKIGADAALAEANACRIEHVISDDLFDLIKKFATEQ